MKKKIARPQSHFPHSCVCERFIYSHDLKTRPILWNVEIGTEAAQFPEKEHINGIFVAVWEPYSLEPTTPLY
jgi:hypothetical protein